MRITPTRQSRRPFSRASHVEGLVACLDDAAVHVAGGDRREFTGGYGDEHFIEKRHCPLWLTEADQRPSLCVPRDRDQIAVIEALTDLCRLRERGERAVGVLVDALNRVWKQQVAAFGTIKLRLIDQPLAAREPTGRERHFAFVHMCVAEPEGAPGGTCHAAAIAKSFMRARPSLAPGCLIADQVRGCRELKQVLGFEGLLAVCRREEVARTLPLAFDQRRATVREIVSLAHCPHYKRAPGRRIPSAYGLQVIACILRVVRGPLRLAAVLLTFAALFGACGVAFSESDEGTEFFKRIQVSGPNRADVTMTVLLDYEQYYPVDVVIRCELRTETALVAEIAPPFVAPKLPLGTPDSTPVAGAFARDFVVEEPGTYRVECLTPQDEDNFIAEEIHIGPAPTPPPPSPTPLGAEQR